MMNTESKRNLLLVDDTLENLDVLKGILISRYRLMAATNGPMALKIAANQSPDLILLDVMMPGMDGYSVCSHLKSDPKTADIPVIFVTAMKDIEDEERGFDVGGVDYIMKPVHPALVLARVAAHLELADQRRACEDTVKQRTHELALSQKAAIHMLGHAGHYNDTDTGVHIWRMAAYSAALARALNWPVDMVELLRDAAAMHDTGKIGTPDTILKAPRKLSDDEWQIMRQHTEIGYRILREGNTPLFQMAADIALNHHEKWNGTGYPNGISGDVIPESARIVAVADVFDALTMKRPYKDAWPLEKAFSVIKEDAGKHFDPNIVELFFSIDQEILMIKSQWDQKEKDGRDEDFIKMDHFDDEGFSSKS
jgi:putative two-component system response regulator